MFEFDDDKNFAKVIGVGDFGSKAVNYLIENGLIDVEFVAVSSKNESLLKSAAQQKIKITDLHSEESNKKFSELVKNTDLIFIVNDFENENQEIAMHIAESSEKSLTLAIVPESSLDKENIEKLQNSVDCLIAIEHNNLNLIFNIVRCVVSLSLHSVVGLDFADVCCVLKNSNRGYVLYGKANGKNADSTAFKNAISTTPDILSKSKRILIGIFEDKNIRSSISVAELICAIDSVEKIIMWGMVEDIIEPNLAEVVIIAV